jgi:hypothetical protein
MSDNPQQDKGDLYKCWNFRKTKEEVVEQQIENKWKEQYKTGLDNL